MEYGLFLCPNTHKIDVSWAVEICTETIVEFIKC